MGRGRAKAKQTKVARQLKYNTPDMDLDSLQRELAGQSPRTRWDDDDDGDGTGHDDDYHDDDYEVDSQYADYADWDEDKR